MEFFDWRQGGFQGLASNRCRGYRAEEMNTLANLGLPPGAYRLDVNLKDARGAVLGTNVFMFEILPPSAAK